MPFCKNNWKTTATRKQLTRASLPAHVGVGEMTDAERREALVAFIQQRTAANTTSKEVARQSLIARGFYTEDGQLALRYGGKPKTAKKAKKIKKARKRKAAA
jgi:hypothetical protein